MKIIHLMTKEKFTKRIVLFYQNRMKSQEHEICYISYDETTQIVHDLLIPQYEFFFKKNQKNNYRELISFLKKYDYIVLHSLFMSNWLMLGFILHGLLKKTIWIEWGFDLYSWSSLKKISFPKYIFGRLFRRKVNTVVCIFEPDIELYKRQFPHSKSKIFYAPYYGDVRPEFFSDYSNKTRLETTIKNGEPIFIQVGHSSTKEINHIDTLKALSKFSDKNIKIVLPLSYGDSEYSRLVKEFAFKMFPSEKLLVLEDFIPMNDYFNLIKRVDIAIFDTHRQIALGNIQALIFNNSKVFLRKGSVMYDYFLKKGVPVQNASIICDLSYEDFISPVHSSCPALFSNYLKSLNDMDGVVSKWESIYSSLEV